MSEIPQKTPEERLLEKLAAFDEQFQQTVLAYKKAPTPAALAAIVQGVIAHHA
jgi:hypothetical protein